MQNFTAIFHAINNRNIAEAKAIFARLNEKEQASPLYPFMKTLLIFNESPTPENLKSLDSYCDQPFPVGLNAIKTLINYYSNLQNNENHLKYLYRLQAERPILPAVYSQIHKILMAQKKWANIIQLWQKSIAYKDNAPLYSLAFNHMATAYLALKDTNNAMKSLDQSLKAAPNNIDALEMYALIKLNAQDYHTAYHYVISAWRQHKKFNPVTFLNLLNQRIIILEKLNKKQLVFGLTRRLLTKYPVNIQTLIYVLHNFRNTKLGNDLQKTLNKSFADKVYDDESVATIIKNLFEHGFNDMGALLETTKKRNITNTALLFAELDQLITQGKASEAQNLLQNIEISTLTRAQKTMHIIAKARIAGLENNFELAEKLFSNALNIFPNNGALLFYWAKVLMQQYRNGSALAVYEQALHHAPNAINNYAALLFILSQCNLHALSCYVAYCAKGNKDNLAFNRNLSIGLLTLGHYEEGFEHFEKRWNAENDGNAISVNTRASFPFPILRNPDQIKGKRILINCEQGLGDAINFHRYINLVINESPQFVTLILNSGYAPLSKLFKQHTHPCLNIVDIVDDGTPFQFKRHDFQCSNMDLAQIFKTAWPNNVPLPMAWSLSIQDALRWQQLLPARKPKRLRIGFAYQGGKINPNNTRRSLTLEHFSRIFAHQADFISLQIEFDEEDEKNLNQLDNVHLMKQHIDNFYDTATLSHQLDMVITVDTAVAHLCATQGIETWMLIAWRNDWRWGLIRRDTPWYPSMKIYRQHRLFDWDTIIQMLDADLRDKIYFLQNG